jgi:hypothetical protein
MSDNSAGHQAAPNGNGGGGIGGGHGGGGIGGGHGGGDTAGGGDRTNAGQVFNIILAVLVTTIVTALLTLAGTFLFQGAAIRALGGLAVSQVRQSELYEIGTNCGDKRVAAMSNSKQSFCFLTDISIRQPISTTGDNKGGWNVCNIEP